MNAAAPVPSASEPSEWFIVFHRDSANWFLGLLACGEFKHVSAFGYCAGFRAWVTYDVQWSGTRVRLMDQQAVLVWTAGCDILKIAPTWTKMGLSSRFPFTCVAAIKHLIGLRCVAATPGQLYRHILRSGGCVIHGAKPTPADAGRSVSADRGTAGANPADRLDAGTGAI